MWNLILVRLEIVSLSLQDRSMVVPNIRYVKELFWTHSMVLLGDEAQVEPLLVRLEIVLILTQETCMVCTKHTIGSNFVLDAPDRTLR
jgi:hypothetical protein